MKSCCVILLILISALDATAQTPNGLPIPVPAQGPVGRVSTGTVDEPDFFVVNSARCPQMPLNCEPRCDGIVHRFLPDCRYHVSSRDDLINSFQPGVPVCIVVHGSFVGAADVYMESVGRYRRMLQSAGNRPLHFIAAHWPSETGLLLLPTIQTNALGRRAEFNGIYLAQLIGQIPPSQPVSLIGHSHGCRVVASALHLLAGGAVRGFTVADPSPERPIRAVFGAAAIDHTWLNPGQKYGRALLRVEQLLNIKNETDLVLNAYPLRDPRLRRAFGQVGLSRRDVQMIGPLVGKIREFDATRLVGSGHMIEAYAPHPQIRSAYLPYVYFD